VVLRLPHRRVPPRARAVVQVVATIPGGRVAATGRVVVRDGRKVVAARRLTAARKGTLSLRLPRMGTGHHRLLATLAPSGLHVAARSARRTLRIG
jgi:hypothetical protein